MLEAVEEPLDPVALSVDRVIDAAHDLDVALARDVGGCTRCLDRCDDGLAEVASVSEHVAGQAKRSNEVRSRGLVGGLPRREQQPDGQPVPVDDRVYFRRQSPARETDGVIRAPLFPPAACWCARTMELSIR